jgi:hypothetical protein
LALQTLHRFGTKIRDESVAVLARRAGCEIAAQQFKQLVERLPRDTHDRLLARRDPIKSALDQVSSGAALGPVEEMSAGDQQAILESLLNKKACREFLRWMAKEAGYDVVRAVMVSLLGSSLHLVPAALHEMLMAQTDNNDKFAFAVALCPLVSTLEPDGSAQAFIEVLLVQWSHRADALTLLLEACVGSEQHLTARNMDMLFEACTASKMYRLLMTAPALRPVLEGPADHLQQCIEQALNDRREASGFVHCILLLVLADCALRASRYAGLFEHAADGLCKSVGFVFNLSEAPSKIIALLYGDRADALFHVMFRLRISRSVSGDPAGIVRFLLEVFPEEQDDERLKAAIFKSKLSPLPSTSLEHMTEDETNRWQQDFGHYALEFRGDALGKELFRFCRLLLSHLNDARASPATLGLALAMIEEAVADYGGLPVRPEGLDELLSVMDNAKTRAKGKEKNEATQITIPLPGRSEDVKSLTEVDNEAEFARVISDLIDARLFEAELAMLLVRSMKDLWHGIAQPKLLLALLFKAGVFVDGYQRPAANQLAWLGEQCCTWQTSGRNFVTFLHKEFSSWTPDQWSMVDAEQLAAFMSGVLDSTLDYLDEKPKNIDKIDGHVSTLISLWGILMDKCLGERLDDSKRVQRCLELLELLEKRQSVRIL